MSDAQFHAEAADVYERIKYVLSGPEGLGRAYEIVEERWETAAARDCRPGNGDQPGPTMPNPNKQEHGGEW